MYDATQHRADLASPRFWLDILLKRPFEIKKVPMKTTLLIQVLLLALNLPVLSQTQGGNSQGGDNNSQGTRNSGAPGPVIGAGLPVLLVGTGIWWVVR